MTKSTLHKSSSSVAVAVCAAVFGVFAFVQPYWLDGLWFGAHFHQFCAEEGGATLGAFVKYMQYMGTVDNVRIFNRLAPLFIDYVPKWLDATLLAGMMALLFWCMGRLMGLRRSDGTLWWLALIVLFFGLPWNNNILVPVYSLNYIYPSACALAAVYLSLRGGALSPVLECTASVDAPWRVPTNTGRVGTRHGASTEAKVTFDLLAVVLGVLAGWGHEGIGGIMIAGAVPMMLLVRQFRRYKLLYAVSTLATLVAMAAFFTTHMTERLGGETARAWILRSPATWLLFNAFSVALIAVVIACLCRKSWRRWLMDFVGTRPLAVYFFGLAVAGLALSAIVNASYRVAFWPQICAMVVWGMMLLPWMRRHLKALRPMAWCLGAVCAVLVVGEVWIGLKFRRTYDDAIRQLENPECNTAYIKLIHTFQYPLVFERFAPRSIFADYVQAHFLRLYYGRWVGIVPEQLREVDTSVPVDTIMMAPGGVGYFRPQKEFEILNVLHGDVTTPSGVRHDELIVLINFRAADGTPMVWAQPKYIDPEDVIDIKAYVPYIYDHPYE